MLLLFSQRALGSVPAGFFLGSFPSFNSAHIERTRDWEAAHRQADLSGHIGIEEFSWRTRRLQKMASFIFVI
jgi:hypothetical protein